MKRDFGPCQSVNSGVTMKEIKTAKATITKPRCEEALVRNAQMTRDTGNRTPARRNPWVLDDRTKACGRRGVARARRILAHQDPEQLGLFEGERKDEPTR